MTSKSVSGPITCRIYDSLNHRLLKKGNITILTTIETILLFKYMQFTLFKYGCDLNYGHSFQKFKIPSIGTSVGTNIKHCALLRL